jgi:cytochrome P450
VTEQLTSEPAVTLPVPRDCPYAPPAEYTWLRQEGPVRRVATAGGGYAWAVTRHADVREMLTNPHLSADRWNPGFPALAPGQREMARASRTMITMDPPEHGDARRAVLGEFTVRRIQAMMPRIQEITDQQVDALLASPRPADLVEMLALPVPSLVICELLGVPYADHAFFQKRSARMLSLRISADERNEARRSLMDYLSELITAKAADPGDDLLGRQIRRQQEQSGHVDVRDLTGLGLLLLVAGHETTTNMISLGTLAFLEHPELREQLLADPSRTPAAVEELLRWFSIVDGVVARVAVADTEIGGVPIRAGEGVVALSSAANRDPEVFEDPDEIDFERGARHHLAFGFGAHQCLGQNLARVELQVVFDTLLRRVPGLRLAADVSDIRFKDDAFVYGARELPVTW